MTAAGYAALCYHYVRTEAQRSRWPRVLGNTERQFREHLDLLSRHFQLIDPDEARARASGRSPARSDKPALLLTFDDALSDHHLAARILAERGLKAVFFLPTCVFEEGLPANPIVLHYCLSRFSIRRFLAVYEAALREIGQWSEAVRIEHRPDVDDPWKTISTIKKRLKYELPADASRHALTTAFRALLLKDDGDALAEMHLTADQVRDIVSMGHTLGAHSRTHVSVSSDKLTPVQFDREVVAPKDFLERTFRTNVWALSYPFGEKADYLAAHARLKDGSAFEAAYTIEPVLNTPSTPPLLLGRYCAAGRDEAIDVKAALDRMVAEAAA